MGKFLLITFVLLAVAIPVVFSVHALNMVAAPWVFVAGMIWLCLFLYWLVYRVWIFLTKSSARAVKQVWEEER